MKIIGKVPIWILFCLFTLSQATEIAYTAALPSISKTFGVNAQITSSVYLFGFSLGILSLGRISDIVGRRPVILCGVTLYIIASFSSSFATSIEMLVVLRFLSAIGASVGSVIAQAMARDSYIGRDLSYVYASLAIGMALAPSVFSSISGYIVEYYGWNYIFIFLGILFSLALLVYLKYLPETNPYIGTARNNKYFTVLKVVLSDKIVLLYAIIIGSFNGIYFGFYVEAPFIFINIFDMPPSQYGKLAIFLSLSNMCGSIINRYLIKKFVDNHKIIITGLAISFVACCCFTIGITVLEGNNFSNSINIMIIFIPMMLHMLGHSLAIPLVLRYALEDYAKVTGAAGSVFGSMYYFITATISLIIAKIHSPDTIHNFSLLFLALVIISSCAFYLIQKLHPFKVKYEFQ